MKRLRSVFFWAHLTAGAGRRRHHPDHVGHRRGPRAQAADRQGDRPGRAGRGSRRPLARPLSELVAAAAAAVPDTAIVSIEVERDPAASVAVTAGTRITVRDPYTALMLGEASPRTQAFFRSLVNWHRYVALSGEQRATGRAVTGAANLAFLGLALSGLYLWWPHAWTPQHTRAILAFRRTTTGRARDFNWHNVDRLLVPRADRDHDRKRRGDFLSVGHAAGVPRHRQRAAGARRCRFGPGARGVPPLRRRRRPAPRSYPISSIRAWSRAQSTMPTWRSVTLRVPARPGAPFALTLSDGASWNRFARSQLTLDGATGEVRQWQPYAARVSARARAAGCGSRHTGELGGLAGQIVAGIGLRRRRFLVMDGPVARHAGSSPSTRRARRSHRRRRRSQ